MKKALVLAGGGTRGSYQNGALKALRRIGKADFQIVTGTSIGALNAALIVQKDYRAMDQLWHTLRQDMIISGCISVDMDLNTMINERGQIAPFVKNFLKDRGADTTPLIQQIETLYQPDRFFASSIDFGCVVCTKKNHDPVFVNKEMMREKGVDWLTATSAAYPAFPVKVIDENEYVDGGYFDNLPVDLALRMGADEIVAIDLNNEPQHPNYFNRDHITYIFPQVETGSFLSFDRETIDLLETMGYYDTMKAYGVFDGVKYTFEKMEMPKWYEHFEHELLLLETRIKLASDLNERFRSAQVITDKIIEKQHRPLSGSRQLCFGFLDELMDLCGLDVRTIWKYELARNAILAQFAECVSADYQILPSVRPLDVLAWAKTLDRKGMVAKMVHTMLYPEHEFLKENVVLTVYPFEWALAMCVVNMLEELKGE